MEKQIRHTQYLIIPSKVISLNIFLTGTNDWCFASTALQKALREIVQIRTWSNCTANLIALDTISSIIINVNVSQESTVADTDVFPAGIGTYPANGHNWTPGFLGKAWNKLVQIFDQAFAITFNSHIMDGYRFLLRYYEEGDQIYIFGFSRGAFIARFLARMISQIGLLSRGNEQLVPFAYSNFLGSYISSSSLSPTEAEWQNTSLELVARILISIF